MADVNKDMALVLIGFSKLEYEDRVKVVEAIKEYQENVDHKKRTALVENFAAKAGIPVGPTGHGSCPCCGK